MNVLELFAGIGGMSLGLQRAGMSIVGHVEIDPFCRAVLARHWPEVPSHDDVRTALDWWRSEPRPPVDVVAGGYPCQPESVAGKRQGASDDRWLWPDMARVIHAIGPRWVIAENVGGHRSGGLRFVLRDLERLGYGVTAGTIRACEVGAPHPRPRLFVVADSHGELRSARLAEVIGGREALPGGGVPEHGRGGRRWRVAPDTGTGRAADGISGRLDAARVKALGNAVVPAVAERIGGIVMRLHREVSPA